MPFPDLVINWAPWRNYPASPTAERCTQAGDRVPKDSHKAPRCRQLTTITGHFNKERAACFRWALIPSGCPEPETGERLLPRQPASDGGHGLGEDAPCHPEPSTASSRPHRGRAARTLAYHQSGSRALPAFSPSSESQVGQRYSCPKEKKSQ